MQGIIYIEIYRFLTNVTYYPPGTCQHCRLQHFVPQNQNRHHLPLPRRLPLPRPSLAWQVLKLFVSEPTMLCSKTVQCYSIITKFIRNRTSMVLPNKLCGRIQDIHEVMCWTGTVQCRLYWYNRLYTWTSTVRCWLYYSIYYNWVIYFELVH